MPSYIPWFDHFNPSLPLIPMYIYSLGCLMSITNLACSRSTSGFPSPKHVCCLVFLWLVFSKIHLHQCPPSFYVCATYIKRQSLISFPLNLGQTLMTLTNVMQYWWLTFWDHPMRAPKNPAASTWASQNACSGEASYCVGNLTTFRPPCCEEGQACHVEKMHGETKRWLGSSQLFQPCEWEGTRCVG